MSNVNLSISAGWVALVLFMIFFYDEPDLQSALIHYLMGGES